ncbi:glycoside hydrolase family 26 protein [Streptomyces sp. NPDC060194]|uniref:glycoside hydrolase family 26 protein n=1 Tax=Streptomyces sp. NPDC060194 TaxID=3347069 RepID=UPI00365112E7
MRGAGRVRGLLAAAVLAGLLAGCGTFSDEGREEYRRSQGEAAPPAGPEASPSAEEQAELPFDVRPLLDPEKKYFGVAADGAPASLEAVERYARDAGKKPNVIEFYAAWGDRYETDLVGNAWRYGAVPYIAWEPFAKSLKSIAAGGSDAYIREWAVAVRELNVPVALSFAHEMNGHWYPWGTGKATPKEFRDAYRRVHDIFVEERATQAIWVWSPNVVNPMPDVELEPYWPGETYVDWIGVVGYYGAQGPATFDTLYGPTMRQIRTFSDKPFLIAETAAEAGETKPAAVADLFRGVAARKDVIGFVWFNFDKESDWRITSGPASLKAFRAGARNPAFGFDVGAP